MYNGRIPTATMACNWVATVRAIGVAEVLIGALDQKMMDACRANGVPCILIEGGETQKILREKCKGNVRECPQIYPKMSVLKVGFYRELLSFGFAVFHIELGGAHSFKCCGAEVSVVNTRALHRLHDPFSQRSRGSVRHRL